MLPVRNFTQHTSVIGLPPLGIHRFHSTVTNQITIDVRLGGIRNGKVYLYLCSAIKRIICDYFKSVFSLNLFIMNGSGVQMLVIDGVIALI